MDIPIEKQAHVSAPTTTLRFMRILHNYKIWANFVIKVGSVLMGADYIMAGVLAEVRILNDDKETLT